VPPGPDVTPAGGRDVLHPIGVRAVGQREPVAARLRERADRDPVGPGDAVRHAHVEPGNPLGGSGYGDRSDQTVTRAAVEALRQTSPSESV